MAKYKIGITEAGDAGLDLSWVNKLDTVDGAVVITKCISPEFYDAVLSNKDKLIIHATFTGYGHSVLEPNVPSPYDEFDAIMALERAGLSFALTQLSRHRKELTQPRMCSKPLWMLASCGSE